MRIVFFNRFFHPDSSATSQILSDLAFHLAGRGHDVHVVTSVVPNGEKTVEVVRGVTIHRVARAPQGPHGLARRALAYLDYYRGARRAARELVRRGDTVVLKTDPPLLSSALGSLSHRGGAKVVVWLQDVFPEIAREYGVPGARGLTGALLRSMRDRSLATADAVVAICDRMAARIRALGCVDAGRLHVVHNWAHGEEVIPIAHEENSLRRAWGLEDKFVVGYSGNLGRVHEFDTMLEAAARLAAAQDVVFLVIGRGPRLAEVQARVQREGLSNVRFQPLQARAMLRESLGLPDVHLSVLRPEFEGLVMPSKLYGIMAAGRPTIFVGDPAGETATILAQTRSGVTVRSGDAEGLVAAIRALREDSERRSRVGKAARAAFDEQYAMPLALARWEALLTSLL